MSGVVTLTAAHSSALPSGPIQLVVLDGPDAGCTLDLPIGTYRIGKSTQSHLVLNDPLVSRDHVLVSVSKDGVSVRDLNSKNGTFLGNVRLTEAIVSLGAILRVGGTKVRLASTVAQRHLPPSNEASFGELQGSSLAMREAYAVLEKVAPTDASVLIDAETGCGKELCARAIHAHSNRAGRPFVVCDVGGSARSLIESELFGHERGAFTGAQAARTGVFVEADGGTLFLDEVGELPLELQPRLLRVLESREVKPLGSRRYRNVDFRLVAATNRNLEEEVRAGRFREDLFYRLSVVRVTLPPLRSRKEDIEALAKFFIGERRIALPPETLAILNAYDWPGNVRELRNAIAGALARSRDASNLSPDALDLEKMAVAAGLRWPAANDKRSLTELRNELVDAWERSYLDQLMARCGDNVSRAAREGGMDRAYLHRLLKRHNLGRWGGGDP